LRKCVTKKTSCRSSCLPKKKSSKRKKRVVQKKVSQSLAPVVNFPAVNLSTPPITNANSNNLNNNAVAEAIINEMIAKNACRKIITEEICGDIHQLCGSGSRILWKAVGTQPLGTIKVVNDSNCTMRLTIRRGSAPFTDINDIPPNSETIVTISSLISAEIECIGEGNELCVGSFAIVLHIPFDTKKEHKNVHPLFDEHHKLIV